MVRTARSLAAAPAARASTPASAVHLHIGPGAALEPAHDHVDTSPLRPKGGRAVERTVHDLDPGSVLGVPEDGSQPPTRRRLEVLVEVVLGAVHEQDGDSAGHHSIELMEKPLADPLKVLRDVAGETSEKM